jgi:hypothetical protein
MTSTVLPDAPPLARYGVWKKGTFYFFPMNDVTSPSLWDDAELAFATAQK